jgi:potassium channel subfamily K
VHPVTALGRSIFVFWALLGVGSMTILIAVISDAFSSKYRSVMHSKTFDHAIKQYRNTHSSRNKGRKGASHKIQSDLENIEKLASPKARKEKPPKSKSHNANNRTAHEKVDGSRHPRWASTGQTPPPSPDAPTLPLPTLSDINNQMRQRFEALPPLILEEVHMLREQLRYFLVANGHAHGWSEAAGETGLRYGHNDGVVPDSLRKLVEEITQGGTMTARMKDEVWDDEYARNVSRISHMWCAPGRR